MTVSAEPIITLDDFVGAVLAYYGKEYIPSRYAVLQRFFYELSRRSDLPQLISELLPETCFELGDIFPYSRDIEASLVRLQIDGTLSAMNPDYERLVMDDDEKADIKDRTTTYDSDVFDLILESAQALTDVAHDLGFK